MTLRVARMIVSQQGQIYLMLRLMEGFFAFTLEAVWIRLKKSSFFSTMKSWWSQEFHQINTCYIFVQKGGGCR